MSEGFRLKVSPKDGGEYAQVQNRTGRQKRKVTPFPESCANLTELHGGSILTAPGPSFPGKRERKVHYLFKVIVTCPLSSMNEEGQLAFLRGSPLARPTRLTLMLWVVTTQRSFDQEEIDFLQWASKIDKNKYPVVKDNSNTNFQNPF